MSQLTQIRQHLRQGKKLTFMQAYLKFGVMHLPRRILDLKKSGMLIGDEWVTTPITKKRIKRYFSL